MPYWSGGKSVEQSGRFQLPSLTHWSEKPAGAQMLSGQEPSGLIMSPGSPPCTVTDTDVWVGLDQVMTGLHSACLGWMAVVAAEWGLHTPAWHDWPSWQRAPHRPLQGGAQEGWKYGWPRCTKGSTNHRPVLALHNGVCSSPVGAGRGSHEAVERAGSARHGAPPPCEEGRASGQMNCHKNWAGATGSCTGDHSRFLTRLCRPLPWAS